jgi:hypothetical protein
LAPAPSAPSADQPARPCTTAVRRCVQRSCVGRSLSAARRWRHSWRPCRQPQHQAPRGSPLTTPCSPAPHVTSAAAPAGLFCL